MRIALLNRDPSSHPGGDHIAILALKRALEKRSHYVSFASKGWDAKDLRGFDIGHVQHCQFGWALHNIAKVREAGFPYLLVPMWYPSNEHSDYDDDAVIGAIADSWAIAPFSFREGKELLEWYDSICNLRDPPMPYPIPNGTDPKFHNTKPHQQRKGVIAVSARPGKGEAIVEQACKELGLPFHFVTNMAHDALPAIYANARVFVNASPGERMSLTTGEALCAGCRVIDTIHNRGNEWYPGIVTVYPEIPEQIGFAISTAYSMDGWDYSPNDAARKLTWDYVAKVYEGAYLKCLTSTKGNSL